jgi:hypothetical protein
VTLRMDYATGGTTMKRAAEATLILRQKQPTLFGRATAGRTTPPGVSTPRDFRVASDYESFGELCGKKSVVRRRLSTSSTSDRSIGKH